MDVRTLATQSFTGARGALAPRYLRALGGLGLVLALVQPSACGSSKHTDAAAAAHDEAPPSGVQGEFVGSCSATVGCCGECLEYYSVAPDQELSSALDANCENPDLHCPTDKALGRCVVSTGAVTSVDSYYPTEEDGSVSSGLGEQSCLLRGGTWHGADSQSTSEPLDDVLAIASGEGFSCALRGDGSVWCWGSLGEGSYENTLGNGNYVKPQAVAGIAGATAVAAGEVHACAIVAGGAVKCWGTNADAQLGNGSNIDSSFPVDVTGLSGATALALGRSHSCALIADGTVQCWGSGFAGQLGDTEVGLVFAPQPVPGIAGVTAISAGGTGGTCVVLTNQSVVCWGPDNNVPGSFSGPSPTPVAGLPPATSVSVGVTPCALTPDGDVWCWGENTWGGLGIDSNQQPFVPVQPLNLEQVKAISVGYEHACAVIAAGLVKCWGQDEDRQVGRPRSVSEPELVPGVIGAVALAAGYTHTCALLADGTVWCWGDSSEGETGNGMRGASAPMRVEIAQ